VAVIAATFFLWSAALIGAHAESWPAPVKALEQEGAEILGRFDAPAGLKGYAAIIQDQPMAIYVTGDNRQAIVGMMIDSRGTNLSQEPLHRLAIKPMTEKVWSQLGKSHWIGNGSKAAPRIVYAFTDPNCPFCRKFWNDSQPWVKAGAVQVRHIMVGILKDTSAGKAAALLSATDPQAALVQHESSQGGDGVKPLSQIPASLRGQLDANESLMRQLGASATPTLIFKDATGALQVVQGAPQEEVLKKMMGPR
jgi:thiol:disulfide interchange protein DsbG